MVHVNLPDIMESTIPEELFFVKLVLLHESHYMLLVLHEIKI